MDYLKLLRWQNLLFLAVIFFLPRFFIVVELDLPHALTNFSYFILTLSVVCIAGAGNIINDVYDQEVDSVNKPHRKTIGNAISEKRAIQLFGVLSIIGVGLGIYVAFTLGKPNLAFIHAIGLAFLWLYAVDFKKRPIIGNLIISFLSAFALLSIVAFDYIPAIDSANKDILLPVTYVIIGYAIFAFLTTWIREIIKDIEDFEGDNRVGYKTLPIVMGVKATKIVVLLLLLLLLGGVIWYLFKNLLHDSLSFIYVLSAVLVPLLIIVYLLLVAKVKADYSRLSNLMKIIMFLGILTIMVFTVAMKLNAKIPT
ncbi:MAG: geranylgeranylglycerol-phosphate geranylgeranyltransferase [Schleiferiaceae bacterium]|nr:geranylgeranylglycerol-phosphate geranylgeranyltransferase [Schleiferiaceae bacterium]